MKKIFALLLSLCLVLGSMACVAEGAVFTPGTYEGTGRGYSETDPVTVKVTVDENGITAVEIVGDGEVPLVGRTDGDIDAVAGATMTRDGIKEAVENALAAATAGEAAPAEEAVAEGAFIPGTYEGTGKGYSETDVVTVQVTVDESAITAVEISWWAARTATSTPWPARP